MKRASLDDMLTGKESRYALVIGVAKRAREIADDFKEQGVITDEKPVLMAIEDFKNHKYNILEDEDDED
ncbi:MAG: DNA-directed RNA polymerase subunit omega [Ruminococcus sp.]|nr:DNA-directed RNA polymerase subunit omega [Ruminococcus sp.]